MAKHTHACKYGYVPGEGYAFCKCGAVERVSPNGGKRSKAPADLVRLVKRNHGL